MGFFKDAALVALGGAIADISNRDSSTSQTPKSLEQLIDEYALRHGITGPDQEFYEQIVKIAEGYHDIYSDKYYVGE